jgi:uncharacterized protein YuzE
MKLSYFPDTDSLYIDLSDAPSAQSREVSAGVVLDYDASGNLVGIDIDHASRKVDLATLALIQMPSVVTTDASAESSFGFTPFQSAGGRVTNADIDRIRDDLDI